MNMNPKQNNKEGGGGGVFFFTFYPQTCRHELVLMYMDYVCYILLKINDSNTVAPLSVYPPTAKLVPIKSITDWFT